MGKVFKIRDPKKTLSARREARSLPLMILMILLEAVAIVLFYTPANVVSGGVTGLGMLLGYATGDLIPTWAVIVVVNVPLLVWAYRDLHRSFVLHTALLTFLFSAGIAVMKILVAELHIPAPFDVEDTAWRFVSAMFGAMVMGFCGAMIVRLGGSTGGTDIVALMLSRKTSFPMGSLAMCVNLVIAVSLGILQAVQTGDFRVGVEGAALSVIALGVQSVVFNNMMLGMNRNKTLFIISDKWNEIAPEVLKLHRGVTLIPCKGAFTNTDKTLVYILAKTVELTKIRRIVREHDEHAIVSIVDTREVLGKGFSPVN
ncbi:MAG: YitT family protein [Clostridia bacterium]|nr:YitT family protein [Clostridia bacterium]